MATVLSEVAPLLDGPYNSNDTLLLRAETGPGRNLGLVLLLAAAAVGVGGLAALKAERAEFDDSRTTRTRNWIGAAAATARWFEKELAWRDATQARRPCGACRG